MHKYTILGRPITTTNSQQIISIPVKGQAAARQAECDVFTMWILSRNDDRLTGLWDRMVTAYKKADARAMILKSKEALGWLKSASAQLKQQRGSTPTIEGPCEIELDIYRAINSGDVGNFAKGIVDAIEQCRIVRNDRQFMVERVEKFTDPVRPRVEIRIKERPHTGVLFALPEPEDEPEPTQPYDINDIPVEFLTDDERARLVR